MIPITISYFTKQAESRGGKALPLALAYGVGIVLIFVLLGVAVGPLMAAIAGHPITNLIIGVLFLVFALALLGMIELSPPAFLMNFAGNASSKGGYFGVFLMGLTLVVTSFTCTGPFVGSLLAAGAEQGMRHVAIAPDTEVEIGRFLGAPIGQEPAFVEFLKDMHGALME